MNNKILILVLFIIVGNSCKQQEGNSGDDPVRVIFDTDMGNDIDDALALAMLNNYIDMGLVDMLGVVSSKDNPYSVRIYGSQLPAAQKIFSKTSTAQMALLKMSLTNKKN